MNNTDYFVVLDSDDYFTNKRLILDLYFLFDNNCINSISNRISENDKIIKIYNTYSPTFHNSVFNDIGYFWNVRVAADSEYIKRYISYYKKQITFYNLKTLIQIKRDDNTNLTVDPKTSLNSSFRKEIYNLFHKEYKKGLNNILQINKNFL
jgi:hypothetical protein